MNNYLRIVVVAVVVAADVVEGVTACFAAAVACVGPVGLFLAAITLTLEAYSCESHITHLSRQKKDRYRGRDNFHNTVIHTCQSAVERMSMWLLLVVA